MSLSARLILGGLVLVIGAVAAHLLFDFERLLARYPAYVTPLKSALRYALDAAWYAALGVPILMVAGSVYRLAAAKSGRAMIVAKLFAWFTLWAIGSFAFFFALFLAYAPGLGQGGTGLAAPGLVAVIGYMVIGLGFALSALRKP